MSHKKKNRSKNKNFEQQLSNPLLGGGLKTPSDVLGSYTGVGWYGEDPTQDMDDL